MGAPRTGLCVSVCWASRGGFRLPALVRCRVCGCAGRGFTHRRSLRAVGAAGPWRASRTGPGGAPRLRLRRAGLHAPAVAACRRCAEPGQVSRTGPGGAPRLRLRRAGLHAPAVAACRRCGRTMAGFAHRPWRGAAAVAQPGRVSLTGACRVPPRPPVPPQRHDCPRWGWPGRLGQLGSRRHRRLGGPALRRHGHPRPRRLRRLKQPEQQHAAPPPRRETPSGICRLGKIPHLPTSRTRFRQP